MLFDLRGRGRRNTVKAIYIFLAFLMGGGLIFFGIGGGTNSNGGLFDAFTGNGSSGDTGDKRFEKLVSQAQTKLRTNPKDEAAYVQLIRARIQLAGSGDRYDANTDVYNADGKAELKRAAADWDRFEALPPADKDGEARLATQMVNTYIALGQLDKATVAQEIVATQRDSQGAWSQLAILAYQAGQTRKGDLAGKKALEKTDKDLRNSLKAQLDAAKQDALSQQLQQATSSPTP